MANRQQYMYISLHTILSTLLLHVAAARDDSLVVSSVFDPIVFNQYIRLKDLFFIDNGCSFYQYHLDLVAFKNTFNFHADHPKDGFGNDP